MRLGVTLYLVSAGKAYATDRHPGPGGRELLTSEVKLPFADGDGDERASAIMDPDEAERVAHDLVAAAGEARRRNAPCGVAS